MALWPLTCVQSAVQRDCLLDLRESPPSALCLFPGLFPLFPIPLLITIVFTMIRSCLFYFNSQTSPMSPHSYLLRRALTTFRAFHTPYFCFTFPAPLDESDSLSPGTPHNSVSVICWSPHFRNALQTLTLFFNNNFQFFKFQMLIFD